MDETTRAHAETSGARTWFLTADQRHARLLEGTTTLHGRLHVEVRSRLDESWEELEHGRPSPRSGRVGHNSASEGHENEERLHRFAKEVADWLRGELESRQLERVHAFLSPKFLGQVRAVLPGKLREHLVAHSVNLAHLEAGELAKHPLALELHGDPRRVSPPG